MVGVASKVTKLLSAGLDKKRSEKINFDEPLEWETKTITSAAKTYLRNLPEPLMTFKMHTSFIAAASKFLTMKGSWFKSSLVYLQSKIQQTKMLVTCQSFGDLFLFGLVWQYSSVQTKYNKGRFKLMATYLQQ